MSLVVTRTSGHFGRRVVQHGNAIDAAKSAGVRAVAYTTLPNPSVENPAAIRGHHLDQCSTTVEELTGRPPRTVAEVLRRAG